MENLFFLVFYNSKVLKKTRRPFSSTQTTVRIGDSLCVFRELFFYNIDVRLVEDDEKFVRSNKVLVLNDYIEEIEYYLKSLRHSECWICFCPCSSFNESGIDFQKILERSIFPEFKLNLSSPQVDETLRAMKSFSDFEIDNLSEGKLESIVQYIPDNQTMELSVLKTEPFYLERSIEKYCEGKQGIIAGTISNQIELLSQPLNDYSKGDLEKKFFINNVRSFKIADLYEFEKTGGGFRSVMAFFSDKTITILFDSFQPDQKYALVCPNKKPLDLGNLDILLKSMFNSDNPTIENLADLCSLKISNNEIVRPDNSDKFNDSQIRRLYWLSLRTIDLQLSGLVGAFNATVLAYVLFFDGMLIYFKNWDRGREVFIFNREYSLEDVFKVNDWLYNPL